MDLERFEKQVKFILEADLEKEIFRQNHISGYKRPENDAEHAWHMALMIYLLREYSTEKFDTAKAMIMALIHDIVEIDAGDTYAYDEAAAETQAEREKAAAERIFGILPPDQAEEMKALFEEFESGDSPEAKFARAMDSFQPLLLNNANGGKDWRVHNVKKSAVLKRQQRTLRASPEIWKYSVKLIEDNVSAGNIKEN